MHNIKETIEKIFELHKFGVKYGLQNTINFLHQIGNPHEKLKCFHIVGSNGKGSTASFISSILKEEGFKVGLYMSPHFIRFNERIKVNGKEIEDEYLVDFFIENEEYIRYNKITFFEFTTVLAFKYFADFPVDYAVIEAGLGGRLDSTNVVTPLASIITSISLEHTDILGNSIEQITAEKAAIIKPGVKAFTGLIPKVAKEIIENRCDELGVEYFHVEDFTIKRDTYLELYTEELSIDKLDSPLKGFYQKYNAALSVLVVNKTIDLHNLSNIQKGLKNVVPNTAFQGRYEIYSESPKVILDSAHNPEGIYHFINEFKSESKNYKKKTVLFTALKDKNRPEMFQNIKGAFDEYFVTEIDFERSSKVEELVEIAAEIGIKANEEKDFAQFITDFLKDKSNSENCLVIIGSMYLLGEVKKSLLEINNKTKTDQSV